MIKAITIDLLKVSPNGRAIEYMIDCPYHYRLDQFDVTVHLYNSQTKKWEDTTYSVLESILCYADSYCIDDQHLVGMIDLDAFDVFEDGIVNAMYKIDLRAYDTRLIDTDCPDFLEAHAWISDVSMAYKCMMNDVTSLLDQEQSSCDDSSAFDDLIRKYFILYAHLESMRYKDITEAEVYFKLLNKCFGNCGEQRSSCGKNAGNSACGCAGGNKVPYKKISGCGCGCGCGRSN